MDSRLPVFFFLFVFAAFGSLVALRYDSEWYAYAMIWSAFALVVLCNVLLWCEKYWCAKRQHNEKLQQGLRLTEVKNESWSDGTDVYLYYSDGSTVVIQDEYEFPSWAVVTPGGSELTDSPC
jgi:hypothetical protein